MDSHPEGSGRPSGSGDRRTSRAIVRLAREHGQPVIRVLDSRTHIVLREVPARDFIEFARKHRHVSSWLLGRRTVAVTPSETV